MDTMAVLVESTPDAAAAAERAASATELAKHIKGSLGVTAKVDVRVPGDVERSAGKARRVVDLRKAD